MTPAEKKQVVQHLRAETDAILQGGRRRLDRDVRVLNGLDDVMAAAAEKTRKGEPATRKDSTCPAG